MSLLQRRVRRNARQTKLTAVAGLVSERYHGQVGVLQIDRGLAEIFCDARVAGLCLVGCTLGTSKAGTLPVEWRAPPAGALVRCDFVVRSIGIHMNTSRPRQLSQTLCVRHSYIRKLVSG